MVMLGFIKDRIINRTICINRGHFSQPFNNLDQVFNYIVDVLDGCMLANAKS